MSKKTALEKIVSYLQKRRTGATAPEIAKGAKVNYNTVRRVLGELQEYWSKKLEPKRKCKATGKHLTTYSLA